MTQKSDNFSSNLLLVRPNGFAANKQTMQDNSFQKESFLSETNVEARAQQEFEAFAKKLKAAGIEVHIVENQLGSAAPDAVFPNNWFSTHHDGNIYLYPMKAANRRAERGNPVMSFLRERFKIQNIVDLAAGNEEKSVFLEGTGSIVFDHKNRLAYAALSERTDKSLFLEHCKRLSYTPITFNATDKDGKSVYHTNVMLAVGDKFAIACLDMVQDKKEREMIKASFANSGKSLIEASYDQTLKFCCNSLQARPNANHGKLPLVMSQQAWEAFDPSQKELIEDSSIPVFSPLYTIESCGGGGARCMLAEIYLEPL